MCFCEAIKQRKGIIESCFWICTKHTDCGALISSNDVGEKPAKAWKFERTSIDVEIRREARKVEGLLSWHLSQALELERTAGRVWIADLV
jgi:hypothetical protein